MTLLRRHLGAVLRTQRERQHRTLRDVSASARVSLGYLSEIERGHKEASSELLAAVCDALGLHIADVLYAVADDLAMDRPLTGPVSVPLLESVPAQAADPADPAGPALVPAPAPALEPVASFASVSSSRRRSPRVAA